MTSWHQIKLLKNGKDFLDENNFHSPTNWKKALFTIKNDYD